jgi:hypothetical protein
VARLLLLVLDIAAADCSDERGSRLAHTAWQYQRPFRAGVIIHAGCGRSGRLVLAADADADAVAVGAAGGSRRGTGIECVT